MNKLPELILACVLAYLLGSLSGGIITSRLAHGPDLRTVGSKNTGASNVQRTMGWKYGLITFFFDSLKGVLACWLAELITGDHMAALLAGLCCVIGHNWPVFFHFKGGKGVATTGGVMLSAVTADELTVAADTGSAKSGAVQCAARKSRLGAGRFASSATSDAPFRIGRTVARYAGVRRS